MIYLSKIVTASTETTRLISDISFPQHAHIIESSIRRLKSGMVYPPHRLLESLMEDVEEHTTTYPVDKCALIFAAGTQVWSGHQAKYGQDPDAELHYSVKAPVLGMTNVYAGRVAARFAADDHVSTDASACASSLKVLMDVKNLIDNYGFDRVIVMAAEDAVNTTILELFGDLGVSLQEQERLAIGTERSAFDAVNHGFYLGQGAAIAVFERAEVCKIEPEAVLLGAYSASENYANAIGQREDGEGFVKAIEGTLASAKIAKSSIHLVKTHGTGTPVNNAAEKSALTRTLPEFVATAYKQRVGHTLGVSGLLETGLLLNELKTGQVPAIPNRTESDAVFLSAPTSVPDGPFISLAAGMGNIYSAAVFSREV